MGSLDDPAAFPPKAQVGVESRVSWWADLDWPAPGETTEAGLGELASRSIEISNRQHPDPNT
jgi:hypothetical protein